MTTRTKRKTRKNSIPVSVDPKSVTADDQRAAAPAHGMPSLQQVLDVLAAGLGHPTAVQLREERPATAELTDTSMIAACTGAAAFYKLPFPQAVGVFERCTQVHGVIVSWLTGHVVDVLPEKVFMVGDEWVKQGVITTAEVARVAMDAAKRKPGCPVTLQRCVALAALDAQLTTGLSWTKVTQKFCNCRNVEHTPKCTDKMRKQVKKLKAFLASLSIWRKHAESFLHGDNPI